MKSLTGKFVICSNPETFRTGVIVGVDDHAALVKFDNMVDATKPCPFPSELICLAEMVHAHDEGIKTWGFFDTREELDAHLDWMQAPPPAAEPKVIKMIPKKRKH